MQAYSTKSTLNKNTTYEFAPAFVSKEDDAYKVGLPTEITQTLFNLLIQQKPKAKDSALLENVSILTRDYTDNRKNVSLTVKGFSSQYTETGKQWKVTVSWEVTPKVDYENNEDDEHWLDSLELDDISDWEEEELSTSEFDVVFAAQEKKEKNGQSFVESIFKNASTEEEAFKILKKTTPESITQKMLQVANDNGWNNCLKNKGKEGLNLAGAAFKNASTEKEALEVLELLTKESWSPTLLYTASQKKWRKCIVKIDRMTQSLQNNSFKNENHPSSSPVGSYRHREISYMNLLESLRSNTDSDSDE